MTKRSYVYFIQANPSKRVKIGKANNPETRLKELQTGSPEKLSILGLINCKHSGQAAEREAVLHKQFSDLRLEGEWFDFGHELVAYCCGWGWIETDLLGLRDTLRCLANFKKSVFSGFTQQELSYYGA
jgi:Meiotically Up-regulated Gene 113 (MUG113) protein